MTWIKFFNMIWEQIIFYFLKCYDGFKNMQLL